MLYDALQVFMSIGTPEEKIYQRSGGPGIRTQVLMDAGRTHLPLGHDDLFVNILHKNNNI